MKKILPIILLILLLGGLTLSTNAINHVMEDNAVPAPEFVSIDPDGTPGGSFIFVENANVTIEYTADRYDTEGLILLGTGSNLTADYSDYRAINFTLIDSFEGKSTFEVNVTLTSFTIFYAYAWNNELSNGTMEEFDFFDKIEGHQTWILTGPQYPVFSEIIGGISTSNPQEYYVVEGTEVSIIYTVIDPHNNQSVTLMIGNNETEVYNHDVLTKLSMNQIDHDNDTDISTFRYNYTLNQRVVFFTANSTLGWERQILNPDVPVVHRITNGFSFSSIFSESLGEYTDIDNINVTLSSKNESSEDEFFLRYKVLENSTSDTIIVNWTSISFGNNITYVLDNDTNNFNTSIHEYRILLPLFNISQVVQIQTYVEYKTGSYNETNPVDIIIKDSRPSISLTANNASITNKGEEFIEFSFSNVRSTVKNATIQSNYTSSTSIKGEANFTIGFEDDGEIIEGTHVVVIIVFNEMNQSRNETLYYYIDTRAPNADFLTAALTSTDNDGFITIEFNFTDSYPTDKGIDLATLDWGDGTVQNVTSLSSANHLYRNNGTGTHSLILTVYDLAGNVNTTTLEIQVNVALSETSSVATSPAPLYPAIIALSLATYAAKMKKRN